LFPSLFVLLILVRLLTITACFLDIGDIIDHHCLFCWYWWNCWPSLFKLFFHNYLHQHHMTFF
jgi:hypothetical protein